jgi:hypothetical protein
MYIPSSSVSSFAANLPTLSILRRLRQPGCVGGKRFGAGQVRAPPLKHRALKPQDFQIYPCFFNQTPRSLPRQGRPIQSQLDALLNLAQYPSALQAELLSSHHRIRLRPFLVTSPSSFTYTLPPQRLVTFFFGRLTIRFPRSTMEGVNI